QAVRRSEHFADHADDVESFKSDGDNRRGRNEFLEARVERLIHVLGIVLPRQFGRDTQHLHADDVETFFFEASDHSPHQPPLNAVRLEENQSALHGVEPWETFVGTTVAPAASPLWPLPW